MSETPSSADVAQAERALRSSLALTQDREIDCDEFLERLAELIDGRLMDKDIAALMEHHRKICPECEEERQILERALTK